MHRMYGAAAPGVMPKDTIKIKDEKDFQYKRLIEMI